MNIAPIALLYASIVLFVQAAWSIPVIMSAAAGDYFGPAGAANALAALVFFSMVRLSGLSWQAFWQI